MPRLHTRRDGAILIIENYAPLCKMAAHSLKRSDAMLNFIKAVLYGVIEGITEWLPISSTGHMILAEQFLQFDLSDEFLSMFRVVIQLGAILAVVVLYWKQLWPFTRNSHKNTGAARYIKWPIFRLWCKILVASLPAAVLGLLLDDWMDAHLYTPLVVGIMLIFYGVVFLVVENRRAAPQVEKLGHITYRDALIVGVWQVLALVPGTSRSGATIIGGLLLGMSRSVASRFTFFLAIPVMAGASGLKVIKFLAGGGVFGGGEMLVLATGCVVAFVTSLAAIRFLMNYVRSHDFKVFGFYRIALGVVVLAASTVGFI